MSVRQSGFDWTDYCVGTTTKTFHFLDGVGGTKMTENASAQTPAKKKGAAAAAAATDGPKKTKLGAKIMGRAQSIHVERRDGKFYLSLSLRATAKEKAGSIEVHTEDDPTDILMRALKLRKETGLAMHVDDNILNFLSGDEKRA